MKIGIFWFYSDKIIGIAHEFNSNEKDSIGLIDSKYTHVEYWERIKADIPELRYMEYDEVQRGRVIFDINKKTSKKINICHLFCFLYIFTVLQFIYLC